LPGTPPDDCAQPHHLAYVIYTSGSTGQPKGVMVEHAALANHMAWMQRRFPLTAHDRVLQKTPVSADASVWEFHAPLIAGATLVMAEPGAHRIPAEIAAAVREHGITVLQLVPSMLAALLDAPGLAACGTLRRLYCGGESLRGVVARRLRAQCDAELVNLYGPTEATIDATFHVVGADEGDGPLPIGRPIDNVDAHVLDPAGAPVPDGVVGELCIAGVAVARGYWGRPGPTAERFVREPWSARDGRMYRTGDLARRRRDGTLEFLGRADRQVKIRGARIELEEIEAALASCPNVSDAAAVVELVASGDPRLVGYVVPGANGVPMPAEVHAWLRLHVPTIMLPAAIHVLASFPRLPNGKVDRARLAAEVPAEAAPGGSQGTAPRDAVEEQVVDVVRDVLDAPEPGVHDDFFALGGHSLSAAQVVMRLGRLFGVTLSLRDFFADPTVAGLAAQVRRGLVGSFADGPPLVLHERRDDTTPVSFAQQRMWLLDRLLPAGDVYNTRHVVRLSGALDVDALRRALAALVARHETLRTRFALVDGLPVQVIGAAVDVVLVPEDVAPADALDRAREEALAPFDLACDLPWRVRLWRLHPDEHWLQFTLHHIATDGWSTGVLVREMSQLYAAFHAGTPDPLPPLPVQYADYAVWQRQWLQGDTLARQVDYWRRALAQVPVLALPTDRPRPPLSSHRGGHVAFVVPRERVQALQALGRREGATLFMTLLAAFQVLLARYSGQDDIAVGVPTAGRSRPELEGLIGFFVNTLVLRADLAGAPSFRDLLAQVRDRALEAFAHQDVPFEKLVEELAPQRDLARNPLFQVSMVLQNAPAARWQLPGLQATPVDDVRAQSAKFDLTLILHERDGALHGTLEYAQDLFDAASIERMAAHWQVLLAAIVDAPAAPVAQLPLLTADQREAVLALGRGAAVPVPAKTVHALFAEQAQRSPEALAVVHGAQQLTYRDLAQRAGRLAHRLRALGVGPDVPVGLCLPRSVELVVGMLGILQAGGAYVPLDPDYPAARLAFMLADTAAPVLVTTRAHAGRLGPHAARLVCLDDDDDAAALDPGTPPDDCAQPHHLAYVIYTSGSTGQPKGVMVEHANVAVLARDANYVALGADDVVAWAANVAFDATTFEVWTTLLHGARITVIDADDVVSAAAFRRTVRERGITAMFLTTALFAEIAADDPTAFRELRWLLFGGEAHDPRRVREVMEAGPPRHLVHVYGPTETTTFATFQPVGNEHAGRPVPIGRPIAGTEILVLDAQGRCVPPGVVGEVHIGGRGVARGYLGRDDETRRRFVPHPLRPDAERVFRSGDLARWNAAGALEYVGRNDAMVKIRGFRIEPGEIAAVVGEHPSVRACHVVASVAPSGDPVLVAYVIATDGSSPPPPAELKQHVATRLPSFMVPACWIAVDAFPLTANGKLDVGRLPAPTLAGRDGTAPYAAPQDDLERTLCRIWSDVLGIGQVGIDDDFFALSGHSLLAARAFSRMDEALHVALPLATLFACPTIRALAQRCRVG
ncbi:MAG TPA: amino acid adenylation domain-containing protein, partial [Casimicrobiaceae bacterium]|nr:amino acid adenylation domain-containing protein [Casimicrobiaceae bacterium]